MVQKNGDGLFHDKNTTSDPTWRPALGQQRLPVFNARC